MPRFLVLSVAALISQVAAHGYIETITLDSVAYPGYNRWSPKKNSIGWSYSTEDEGPEKDITSPNFVCRRDAKPSRNYGKVAAGGTASFFWTSDDKEINPNGWAESHHGAVLSYIAPCGADCTTVDKTQLKWTKIAESGLVSGPANTKGVWATDKLRENGGINLATIPAAVAPGRYILRNELIALHRANVGEPEFYMQCGNVEVTGTGTDKLEGGVVAAQLYNKEDKQLFGFDIYDNRGTTWKIPGPALYSGASAPTSATPAGGSGRAPDLVPSTSSEIAETSVVDTAASVQVTPDEIQPNEDGSTEDKASDYVNQDEPDEDQSISDESENALGAWYRGWKSWYGDQRGSPYGNSRVTRPSRA